MVEVVAVMEMKVPMLVKVDVRVEVTVASAGMTVSVMVTERVVVVDDGGEGMPVIVAVVEAAKVLVVVAINW